MRLAMLIVGVIAGLAVAGFFAVVLVGVNATSAGNVNTVRYVAMLPGVATRAWVFGVAFTWGKPTWARTCYVVVALALVGSVVIQMLQMIQNSIPAHLNPAQITSLVLAGIAGALAVMSVWAAHELDAKTERERYQDPN